MYNRNNITRPTKRQIMAKSQILVQVHDVFKAVDITRVPMARPEIAGVLKTMKGGKLSTASIDHAADVADMVATAQSDLGGLGGVMFQGDDDVDALCEQLMAEPAAAREPAPAQPPTDPTAGMPAPPTSPPTAELDVESLPEVFAELMRQPDRGHTRPTERTASNAASFKFTL